MTWSNTGQPVILREMWVHLLAYYQARRPGQIGYSFAKFESMPVHYAVGQGSPGHPRRHGMGRRASTTQPASYARYWDTVLVRTPDDAPDADPRARTFRDAASRVRRSRPPRPILALRRVRATPWPEAPRRGRELTAASKMAPDEPKPHRRRYCGRAPSCAGGASRRQGTRTALA